MCQENNLKLVKIQSIKELIPDCYTLEDIIGPMYLSVNNIGYAYVDKCLADLIEKLNRDGYPTVSCCCGHGKNRPFVSVYIYPQKIRQFKKYLKENSKLFQKNRKIRIPKCFNNDPGKTLKDGRTCATFDAIK